MILLMLQVKGAERLYRLKEIRRKMEERRRKERGEAWRNRARSVRRKNVEPLNFESEAESLLIMLDQSDSNLCALCRTQDRPAFQFPRIHQDDPLRHISEIILMPDPRWGCVRQIEMMSDGLISQWWI